MNILFNGSATGGFPQFSYNPIDKSDEGFSRSSSQADIQQKLSSLLDNNLSKKLNTPALPVEPVNDLKSDNFSPQKVADRILEFVGNSIALRAGSEDEAKEMLAQAREGIEQGIAEARSIIEAVGKLSDEVDSTINETEGLISKGLDELENKFDNDSESPPAEISPQAQVLSSSASVSSQFRQSSEASIEIVTQDGDRIEVSYSAFIQAASSENYASNQQGSAYSYEYSAQSSVAFQFSVQGDIDEGEQQAINELLSEVGELANQFFSGDVQAAFNSSLELGFDSNELKSFALDFQQSTYVEVVQTYQQTQQISNPVVELDDDSEHRSAIGPGAAIDVLSQLEELIEQSKENTVINEPENTIKSLLVDMLELLNEDDNALPLQRYINDVIAHV